MQFQRSFLSCTESEKLSVAYAKLDELATTLFGKGESKPDSLDLGTVLKVSSQSAKSDLLPVSDHGLTIVNLFDQFCADCVSGDRLQTLERLAQLRQTTLAVFSDKNFSEQDIDNFKLMLPILRQSSKRILLAALAGALCNSGAGRQVLRSPQRPRHS